MLFYRICSDSSPDEPLGWAGDFAGAKKLTYTFKHNTDLYVDLVDIPTDKQGILSLLNTGPPTSRYLVVKRTWRVTPRGGLKEEPPTTGAPNE